MTKFFSIFRFRSNVIKQIGENWCDAERDRYLSVLISLCCSNALKLSRENIYFFYLELFCNKLNECK